MIQETTTTNMVQVKLPFYFDVVKMQSEIKALTLNDFVYYKVLSLRAPAHLVDPSLPIPPPAEDYADGSWTDWLNTERLNKSPYFLDIINTFKKHTTVTLVRLLRLAAKSEVREHTDPTLGLHIHQSVVRLTIPIMTNDSVDFFLNGKVVPMKPGECWYLDLTKPHKIINAGTTERINLTIDMIPNDWVRKLITAT